MDGLPSIQSKLMKPWDGLAVFRAHLEFPPPPNLLCKVFTAGLPSHWPSGACNQADKKSLDAFSHLNPPPHSLSSALPLQSSTSRCPSSRSATMWPSSRWWRTLRPSLCSSFLTFTLPPTSVMWVQRTRFCLSCRSRISPSFYFSAQFRCLLPPHTQHLRWSANTLVNFSFRPLVSQLGRGDLPA